jgi:FHS family L-fucose permease-like MFS transporter
LQRVIDLNHSTQNSNVLLWALKRLTPNALPWVSLYWIFTVVAFAMIILLGASRFPRVQHTADERSGTLEMYGSLVRRRVVWLYFLAIFSYVGCEQGTANRISQCLTQYHHFDPHTTGARAISWFWGCLLRVAWQESCF